MKAHHFYLTLATALWLSACGNSGVQDDITDTVQDAAKTVEATTTDSVQDVIKPSQSLSLSDILDAQPDGVKARYADRHPQETLDLFGIKPGMTIAEVLPGGGWYSKILLPLIGDEGQLIGIDYDLDMWGKFGGFADEAFLEDRKNWAASWSEGALEWTESGQTDVSGFAFGSRPKDLNEQVDAVLMIRAMHHLHRFDGKYWPDAISDIKALLKPGGIVGIVQHRAPESNSDAWSNGDNGYIKQSLVITKMEEAGFELDENSDINANEKDTPSEEDNVWRLAPTLGTSRDNPDLRAKMEAIGESDRMTLVFRKPS